jgi:hypothetical protein
MVELNLMLKISSEFLQWHSFFVRIRIAHAMVEQSEIHVDLKLAMLQVNN